MNLAPPSRRRGSLVISVAILKAAKHGINKTNLISSVSMSYEQFLRYIEFLKAHGLIERCETMYHTTEKGLKLVDEFDSLELIHSVLAL